MLRFMASASHLLGLTLGSYEKLGVPLGIGFTIQSVKGDLGCTAGGGNLAPLSSVGYKGEKVVQAFPPSTVAWKLGCGCMYIGYIRFGECRV